MPDRKGATVLLLLTLYQAFHSTHCEIILDITDAVVQVNEKEVRQLVLNTNPITCNETEGNSTRVYWKSTSPTTLCGKCFQVLPTADGTGYNLVYIPAFATLRHGTRPSYVVTLGCTDDIQPEVTGIIDVIINPNTPPHFTVPTVSYTLIKPAVAALNKKLGDLIYNVDAEDSDNDAVFYKMYDVPATGLFDIGNANGEITAKKNLNLLCDPSVQFYVTVEDNYNSHSPVGPVIINSVFAQTNKPPVVPADVTIQIPETTPAGSIIVPDLGVTDDGVSPNLYYTMRATPERGLEYYSLDLGAKKKTIKTLKPIDYEYLELRTVTLTIDVTDGYCKGPSQKVTIQITDENEIPVVDPEYREVTVYEGFINVDPQWNLIDPDEYETHKWSVVTGTSRLDVDEDTGEIFSVGEMNIDPNRELLQFPMSLRVVDKNNARSKPEPKVKVIVLDKNDNTPTFNLVKYELSASPCSKVGKVLGTVRATDLDSEFQGNNMLVFSGHSRNMSVMANGDVILTQPCVPEGAFDSLQASVTDQGIYPGPLVGVPVPVSLTCGPCPTPLPSSGGGNTTGNGTGTGTTVDTSNTTDFFDANLSWLVPAILLGSILLGLLAYLLWRYCSRAYARWKAAQALRQKTKQTMPEKPKYPKKEVRTKQKKPRPPTPPPPEPEPVLFGFWKETYPDRDQRHAPKHQATPASVEADKRIEEQEKKEEEEEKKQRKMERQKELDAYQKELEEYHKKVNEINNANNAGNPAPPKKLCAIL